jgi:uncharacterized membrane protein
MSKFPLARMCKHLSMTPWRIRSRFPRATLDLIEREIRSGEAQHGGEICFVVEGALHAPALYSGQTPRERAIEVFSMLRLWDTEHRNAVLIYVLLADRAVEVVADRGVRSRVTDAEWQGVCRAMERAFGQGSYHTGTIDGIRAVSHHLLEHFPMIPGGAKEIPDKPVVL